MLQPTTFNVGFARSFITVNEYKLFSIKINMINMMEHIILMYTEWFVKYFQFFLKMTSFKIKTYF